MSLRLPPSRVNINQSISRQPQLSLQAWTWVSLHSWASTKKFPINISVFIQYWGNRKVRGKTCGSVTVRFQPEKYSYRITSLSTWGRKIVCYGWKRWMNTETESKAVRQLYMDTRLHMFCFIKTSLPDPVSAWFKYWGERCERGKWRGSCWHVLVEDRLWAIAHLRLLIRYATVTPH